MGLRRACVPALRYQSAEHTQPLSRTQCCEDGNPAPFTTVTLE
ncbi:predicted protein [Plenodomus lingam JN3]|uniref:Predicted protein n=1 Tax=Leptosphaeria maculans (strain JN3 / isolate v23.1.3 / race Av1-4-5-6-7-8) TaxID=985895 RepID=E5A2J0_LEPMJ|nr:predicted protein [Plenodomus lingam JN3]CBX97786.1 predicted protein [Plenodomus lingam JN3]